MKRISSLPGLQDYRSNQEVLPQAAIVLTAPTAIILRNFQFRFESNREVNNRLEPLTAFIPVWLLWVLRVYAESS